MKKALFGKKIGMTQIFDAETGKETAVTVLDVSENFIAREVINGEIKHAEISVGKRKGHQAKSGQKEQYKKLGFVPRRTERVALEAEDAIEVGTELGADVFEIGDMVDVSGTTKGKGFAGVMKRHNFQGDVRTHGRSDRERAPGSIGSGTTPGRVLKGKKMAGHMGSENLTVRNLKIVQVDAENKLLAVSGAIPGPKKRYVFLTEAKKIK